MDEFSVICRLFEGKSMKYYDTSVNYLKTYARYDAVTVLWRNDAQLFNFWSKCILLIPFKKSEKFPF